MASVRSMGRGCLAAGLLAAGLLAMGLLAVGAIGCEGAVVGEPLEDCANTIDDDDDGLADCADDACLTADACRRLPPAHPVQRVQQLFDHRCGCHVGALAEFDLSLEAPFTAATVGVAARLAPGLALIAPGERGASFLYLKLSGELTPEHGARMPPELPYLDETELALVGEFIDAMR